MVGKVLKVNNRLGLVIFENAFGGYGYFEILENDDFETDEIIIGNLHSFGDETIVKQSTNTKVNVFIEDYGMTYKTAIEIVFIK